MQPERLVEVLEQGALTTVQDPRGRPGWRRYGVPVGGAADPWSARLSNRLAANPEDAALLEATLLGPALRFGSATLVAVAGADLGATLDGRPMRPGTSLLTRPGSELRFGTPRSGARAYLGVGGGLEVSSVLGSASTDLRTGFGGLDGRALHAGDRLTHGAPADLRPRQASAGPDHGPIRVLPGPHLDRFVPATLDRLCRTAWTVSVQADRGGVRLDGPSLAALVGVGSPSGGVEVASVGLPPGAIQVPPDGRPIVMLADRPVTGGYAVVGCVIRADIGRVAQLATGDEVGFSLVGSADALHALAERERSVARDLAALHLE